MRVCKGINILLMTYPSPQAPKKWAVNHFKTSPFKRGHIYTLFYYYFFIYYFDELVILKQLLYILIKNNYYILNFYELIIIYLI